MASVIKNTSTFFTDGTIEQFEHVMSLYPQVLRLKAESKNKKPEELIKLDNWYQNELPKKIKSRGKDAHLNHDELCQLMKWKQTRGKFYPQLSYLVKVNTPRAVLQETKKAFKKLPNLELAITALSNLKGVGTTLASALLAAATPETAPFMADECLMAIPEIEGIDYTTKEYLKFVNFINITVERLNKEAKSEEWSAHKVELAVWTHYVACELKPELLDDIPLKSSNSHTNGDSNNIGIDTCSDESNLEPATNKTSSSMSLTTNNIPSEVEDTSSLQSLVSEKSTDNGSIEEETNHNNDDITNDSVITNSDTNTNDNIIDNNTNDNIVEQDESSVDNTIVKVDKPKVNTLETFDNADDNATTEPPMKKTKLDPELNGSAEVDTPAADIISNTVVETLEEDNNKTNSMIVENITNNHSEENNGILNSIETPAETNE